MNVTTLINSSSGITH